MSEKEQDLTIINENKPTPEQAKEKIKELSEYLSRSWKETKNK